MPATPPPEPRRTTVRLPDGEMSMLDFGDPARPVEVVFAHANGFNARTYASILGPLGADLRVLAVDLRGHGESTLPAEPAGHRGWDVYARDLGVLLAGIEARRPPVLSGHSMGGTAMLLAAARSQGRARRLVLFEPVILPRIAALYGKLPWAAAVLRRRFPLARRAQARRAVFESRDAALAAYAGRGAFRTWPAQSLADYVAGGFRDRAGAGAGAGVELACAPAWEAANFAAQGADPYPALAAAGLPLTILKAEHGSTCRADPGVLKRYAKVKTVPGSSHFLPMERPDVVRQFLLDAVQAP